MLLQMVLHSRATDARAGLVNNSTHKLDHINAVLRFLPCIFRAHCHISICAKRRNVFLAYKAARAWTTAHISNRGD